MKISISKIKKIKNNGNISDSINLFYQFLFLFIYLFF